MPKELHNDVLDSPCNHIADNGNHLTLCSAMPTDYTEATATYMLVQHTLTTGDGMGDYQVADGETTGRKLTVAQQTDLPIANTGQAQFAAICDTINSKVLLVTTVTPQMLTQGGTVTVPAFAARFPDPV